MPDIYAKLVSETSIRRDVPKSAVIDGAFVCGTLPEPYLNSQGWYRLVETPMPTARDGYHYEFRFAYDDESAPTAILKNWIEVENPPPPPRVFSKLKIVSALIAANLWDQAKAYIDGAGLYDLYLAAVTFREDNPYFAQGLAALQAALGVPDVQVEEILAASVAD